MFQSAFDFLSSDSFRRVMYSLSISSILLAVGFTLLAFAFYGRGREADGLPADQLKWVLLFATWRDSLIITLLYLAENMSYKFAEFHDLSQLMTGDLAVYAPVIRSLFSFVLQVLIFAVAALRIIALSRGLAALSKR